jgi:uncharacterized protein DUF4112
MSKFKHVRIERAGKTNEAGNQPYLQIASFIASLLDTAFHLPGTRIRVGLDPLLGLIPGFGDTLSNLIGSSLLFVGVQLGLPRIVLIRMSVNLFLNTVIGAIPGFGDLFSFWFKSNMRNLALLKRYGPGAARTSTAADWTFVVVVILLMVSVFVLLMLGSIWLIKYTWDAVSP